MKEIKIYFTGKMNEIQFMNWVDTIKNNILDKINERNFCILDSSQKYLNFNLGHENYKFNFARNTYMILKSDIVIINFDGISNVNNINEIYITKKFKKNIIGFSSLENEEKNKNIKKHVPILCNNLKELRIELENISVNKNSIYNCFSSELIQYYLENFYDTDLYVKKKI